MDAYKALPLGRRGQNSLQSNSIPVATPSLHPTGSKGVDCPYKLLSARRSCEVELLTSPFLYIAANGCTNTGPRVHGFTDKKLWRKAVARSRSRAFPIHGPTSSSIRQFTASACAMTFGLHYRWSQPLALYAATELKNMLGSVRGRCAAMPSHFRSSRQ